MASEIIFHHFAGSVTAVYSISISQLTPSYALVVVPMEMAQGFQKACFHLLFSYTYTKGDFAATH
jgi:hypothetical protein